MNRDKQVDYTHNQLWQQCTRPEGYN